MRRDVVNGVGLVAGRVRAVVLGADGRRRPVSRAWRHNDVIREWGAIVAQLLATGQSKYRVSRMYMEFANVASPGDPASIPAFDRSVSAGRPYYDALLTSPDRDYLRVPITSAIVSSSDDELFPNGNLVTYFALSSGVVGVHGKPFGNASNSVLVGGALVAAVEDADPTRDLIFSRFYFDVSEQVAKPLTAQVGIEWESELQ